MTELSRQTEIIPIEGSIRETVILPEGENRNEWLARGIFHFCQELTWLNGPMKEFCTDEACPEMTAGPGFVYLWQDSRTGTPRQVTAPQYIGLLLGWVNKQLEDEQIFPAKDSTFPPDFDEIVRNIMKRLFRVYAHFYYHHFGHFTALEIDKHLNTSFQRFIFFVKEFDLLSEEELEPLSDLIAKILAAPG